jgi:predicted Ser/Thr protein kinase
MELVLDYSSLGMTTLLVVIAYFTLQKLGERLGEDLYGGARRLVADLLARLGRRLRGKPAKAPVAILSGPTVPPPQAAVPAPAARPAGQPEIQTPAGRIQGLERLADGDEARLFRAELLAADGSGTRTVVVKIAASDTGAEALGEEAATLRALAPEARQYAKHLPRVVTQFRLADQRPALVLEHLDGLTLTRLRERFPAGIEPRHLVWMFRRALSVLGYVHSQGVLHGNLTPDHILVRPRDHNVWLLDWSRAISQPRAAGQHFRIVHPVYGPPEAHQGRPALPASDLYSLALCMVYGLGCGPGEREPPAHTPEPLARLLRALLLESPLQRPGDAWALYHELETIRDQLFGPHRFVEFVVDP